MAEVRDSALNTANAVIMTVPQERQMDLVEVLSFLFMLSTMELGRVSGPLSLSTQRWLNIFLGLLS